MKENKQSVLLLENNFGIGLYRTRFLLTLCGINYNYNLTIKEYFFFRLNKRINKYLFVKTWVINEKLRYRRRQYIVFLKSLVNFYKFIRLRFGLPIRGQRTHSNRQTVGKVSNIFKLIGNFNEKKSKRKKLYFKKKKRNFFFHFLKYKRKKRSKKYLFK
jgi:ribosomal protein S13